jgi:EAL domain-containing protein (putative c-di-GMP-specific phosphodiesterase class I)
MAVNVAARQFREPGFVRGVATALARAGIAPAQMELEITERTVMEDLTSGSRVLSELKELGVRIALDDFGTGYSSMQHLRRLPLTEIKIDRSFVLGMAEDSDDHAIVRSMIELAGALGLRVVAEGVEDERAWRLLHAAGCEAAQGWFYARPLPADEVANWLARSVPPRPRPAHRQADAPARQADGLTRQAGRLEREVDDDPDGDRLAAGIDGLAREGIVERSESDK